MKLFLFILILGCFQLQGAGVKVISKAVAETVKSAMACSKRTLNSKQFQMMSNVATQMSKKYGDDILPLIQHGGVEFLEQAIKYGDEFILLAKKVPHGARSLALHASELLPLAKRIGPEVLEFEVRAPGLCTKVVQEFGDDGVKLLLNRPVSDITRLLGYAKRADSIETKKLLWECYQKSPVSAKFLDKLDWKKIMASGLSAAAIISAYKVSNGLESGISDPKVAKEVVSTYLTQLNIGFFLLLTISLLVIIYRLHKKSPKQHKQEH